MPFGRDFFAALGRVVYEATLLELEAAFLRAKATGEDFELPVGDLGKQGVVEILRKEIRALQQVNGTTQSDRALLEQAMAWANEASELLDQRHRHVHTFWHADLTAIADGVLGAQPQARGEHARTGAAMEPDPLAIEAVADRISAHKMNARGLGTALFELHQRLHNQM